VANIRLSLVIPCLSLEDRKLKELLASIERQDFPKDEMEVLVITDGTSESAKAIGIRRANGEVIGILASDNELIGKNTLKLLYEGAIGYDSCFSMRYFYKKDDDILNRYFSLIGGNDVLSYYLGKNDRCEQWDVIWTNGFDYKHKSLGDNGFFVKKSLIESTDLNNYYHVDNATEAINVCPAIYQIPGIWHKTGGNIFSFFRKRYRYGLQHAFNPNRRWHLVDFRKPQDIWRLVCFIFVTLTVIQPLMLSIRGYLKIRDVAWFLHWPICLITLFTYGLLVVNLTIKRIFQLLSAPLTAQRA